MAASPLEKVVNFFSYRRFRDEEALVEYFKNLKPIKWGLLLLVIYTALHLFYSSWSYNPFVNAGVSGDFAGPFRGMLLWKKTGNFETAAEFTGSVFYGPLYYILLRLFGGLELKQVCYFFYLIQFPLFIAAAFYLVQAVSIKPPKISDYCIIFILIGNFFPFLEILATHKVEGILFFLLCLAIYLFRRKRDFASGIILAIGAALKWFPGVLAIYFLLKKEFKALMGMVVGLGALFLLSIPILGISSTRFIYLHHPISLIFDSNIQFNTFHMTIEWQTVGVAVMRWFTVTRGDDFTFEQLLRVGNFPEMVHPYLALGIATFLKVLLGGACMAFIATRSPAQPYQREANWERYPLEISLVLLLLFIIPQGFRHHYAILFLPAYAAVGLLLYQYQTVFHLPEKTLFVCSYVLSGTFIPLGILNYLPPHPLWGREYSKLYAWLSVPVYGYLLLGLCILICYKRISALNLSET